MSERRRSLEIADHEMREFISELSMIESEKQYLLPSFHVAQEIFGWVPPVAVEKIADFLRVPLSEVYATLTAYSELRITPDEKDYWFICTGVACEMKGAQNIVQQLADADEFNVRDIDCQFLCSLAPVCVDDSGGLHGRVEVSELISRIRESQTGGE